MNTILTAAQINRLAQRLSEKPLGRSASATTAAERLQRLLAVRIGAERAAATAKAIIGAPGFETAKGRLVAEIEGDEDEADVGTLAAVAEVVPAPAQVSTIAVWSQRLMARDCKRQVAGFQVRLAGLNVYTALGITVTKAA